MDRMVVVVVFTNKWADLFWGVVDQLAVIWAARFARHLLHQAKACDRKKKEKKRIDGSVGKCIFNHQNSAELLLQLNDRHLRTHTRARARAHTHTYTLTHIHTHTHTHTHTHSHTHTHTHTHIHTHTHTHAHTHTITQFSTQLGGKLFWTVFWFGHVPLKLVH